MDDKNRRSTLWREAIRATSLGWDLALPIFGGVLLGHLIDQLLSIQYVFTLAFLLLGIATGFYNVLRSIRRIDRRSRRRATPENDKDKEGEA